ncbi:hypothetical protein EFK50_14435 [Nocardioides marmoriginsengisoli]|uniref:Ig-like domain repeat protein n=1 Tax=Nocardioides marmoriginsengisoli TaxID=661483 RepID=A0A3N0CHJ1_9ACTN|nr:hypothetical protein [Nocardioides marmoriginsengisoli]RNL62922.1 hypothetical protein EFK50_14435 [Nocardioides marmoriginsengisoli]
MKTWPKLRAAGICVLTTAVTVTVTQVLPRTPAQADPPPPANPITVITSPPLNVPVQPPPLIVQKHDPIAGATPIVVDNPGGTSPTAQECIPLDTKNEIFCLGESGDALYPSGVFLPPFKVTNGFTAPGDLPGDKMDWIISEAYAATADAHGVANDDLIKAYARPEIRAYVNSRLDDIINKKLYGQPMTTQENQAYLALEDHFRTSQVKAAKAALYEYDLWSSSPCTYVPPTPPPGMPFVANPVIGTAGCSQANKYDLFRLTKGTPPAETFDKWASYRHPSALVANANDPRIRYMIGKTREAIVAVGALGIAGALGVGVGIGVAVSATVAAATAAASLGEATVASALTLGSTAAAAGPAIIFAIAIIIIAVAISQMDADAAPGEQIRDRAARAASNTDPLGVRGRIADYAGMTLQQFLNRQEPVGKDPAIVHNEAFTDGLEAQVAEWMLFDQGGDRLDDPVLGYTVTESAPDDIHFAVNGNSVPRVDVKAPPGALDRDAHPVSDYRVLFSRNWPMVAERRSDTGAWSPYRARLALTYVDQDGKRAQMSLIRHKEGSSAPKIDFNLVRPEAAAEADRNEVTPEWTFTKTGGGVQTVSLLPFDTTLRPVNVVPSVQGILIADNTVKFSANLSTPGQSLPGSYSWILERLNADGTVAETIPVNPLASPAERLTEPGRYRATAGYTVTGPPSFTRSGVVEFTMSPPAPEIGRSDGFNFDAKIRDERVLNGSLFLDLRMLQATEEDDFTVKVDWADDGRGNVVSKTYDVHCQDSDGDIPTCDTGPMILPETAPTNQNWSESPVFRIPDDQDFLPNVNVTITNGYGQVVTRSFPIEGDHRPSYATMTPHAEMAAGKTSTVDVVEVFPSPLLTESQELTIRPYVNSIRAQLPADLVPTIEERNGHWYLQITGTPQADAIGTYVFYFPFEQEPEGKALRPAPALASVEIKAATSVGYRSVLRGTPTVLADRKYRNAYPDYQVQVAQELNDGENTFGTFTGTVMCKLEVEHFPVFDKPCANNKRFPWPTERLSGTMEASTYLVSATQPVSADGPYKVGLSVRFVDPTITQVAGTEQLAKFKLVLRDPNPVPPPYAGYTVTCSQDGRAFAPCFAGGALSLLRTPGRHTLDVRVAKGAPDAATTTVRFPWTVATPAKRLGLKIPTTTKKRGTRIVVSGSGMLPGESYVIRIGGVKVGTGKATSAGTFRRTVKIPAKFKTKKYAVLLTGATTARKAVKTLKVRR